MLTINLKYDNSEQLIEARSVQMQETQGHDENGPYEGKNLLVSGVDGEKFVLESGRAFVMNDNGATIARYDLGVAYFGTVPPANISAVG